MELTGFFRGSGLDNGSEGWAALDELQPTTFDFFDEIRQVARGTAESGEAFVTTWW